MVALFHANMLWRCTMLSTFNLGPSGCRVKKRRGAMDMPKAIDPQSIRFNIFVTWAMFCKVKETAGKRALRCRLGHASHLGFGHCVPSMREQPQGIEQTRCKIHTHKRTPSFAKSCLVPRGTQVKPGQKASPTNEQCHIKEPWGQAVRQFSSAAPTRHNNKCWNRQCSWQGPACAPSSRTLHEPSQAECTGRPLNSPTQLCDPGLLATRKSMEFPRHEPDQAECTGRPLDSPTQLCDPGLLATRKSMASPAGGEAGNAAPRASSTLVGVGTRPPPPGGPRRPPARCSAACSAAEGGAITPSAAARCTREPKQASISLQVSLSPDHLHRR